MPVQFEKIWYLPSENTWKDLNLLAMRDSGTLAIDEKSLGFKGKSTKININNIKSVSYGKQGRDFVNNWVRVEYVNDKGQVSQAFFADGRFIGWSGIFGGTKKIYQLIKPLQGKL